MTLFKCRYWQIYRGIYLFHELSNWQFQFEWPFLYKRRCLTATSEFKIIKLIGCLVFFNRAMISTLFFDLPATMGSLMLTVANALHRTKSCWGGVFHLKRGGLRSCGREQSQHQSPAITVAPVIPLTGGMCGLARSTSLGSGSCLLSVRCQRLNGLFIFFIHSPYFSEGTNGSQS